MAVDPERASASDLDSMEDEDDTNKPVKPYTQANLLAALQDRMNEFNIDVSWHTLSYNFNVWNNDD